MKLSLKEIKCTHDVVLCFGALGSLLLLSQIDEVVILPHDVYRA